MPKIVLYGIDLSPPVRAVKLTLAALAIPYEYKVVNLLALEHHAEDFIIKNPLKTVPLLDDDGAIIGDSHAICAYLVDKYAKDDSLYPRDLVKRAAVNQCMFFEASILFMSLRNVSIPMFKKINTVVSSEKTGNILEGYASLERLLGDKDYLVGTMLTIADLSCAALFTSLVAVVDIEAEQFPKIVAWLKRMSKVPYFDEVNSEGCRTYIAILKKGLTEINF